MPHVLKIFQWNIFLRVLSFFQFILSVS
uniref:Uncharacterized protein n=1 Tax=Lepeophtheirus salmonis TaxID=72036 RepID=A0A0K2U7S1_LEPSM